MPGESCQNVLEFLPWPAAIWLKHSSSYESPNLNPREGTGTVGEKLHPPPCALGLHAGSCAAAGCSVRPAQHGRHGGAEAVGDSSIHMQLHSAERALMLSPTQLRAALCCPVQSTHKEFARCCRPSTRPLRCAAHSWQLCGRAASAAAKQCWGAGQRCCILCVVHAGCMGGR